MSDYRSDDDLGRLLAVAAPEIHAAVTLEDTLKAITYAARDEVPGFDHVGVTVVQGDGAFTTMASTGEFARDMDTLQYDCDQGPCLDAIRRERLVLAEHLEEQGHNWPLYVPWATEAGVRAQMGVRVRGSDGVLGSLNFYSMAARTVNPEAPYNAERFATHAALALDHARRAGETREGDAVRHMIGEAVAILRERYGITGDRALDVLTRVAVKGQVELREVAEEVVHHVPARAAAPPTS